LKIFKQIQNYTRTLSICLVFGVLATFTATLQAETNPKQSQTQTLSNRQIECLVLNSYHEARSEGEKGMLATIFVVLNRTKDRRFPSTPCKVIAQKNQFVWYGKGKTIKEPEMYDKAKQLVHDVLEGKHKDFTRGSIYFNAGESFFVNLRSNGYLTSAYAGSGVTTIKFSPEILDTINLKIDLDPELVFTGLITYKSMLPKIKCSDWLKDMCIRFGLLLAINEDTKVVTVNQIDALIDNIPNSIDWSNKLDESEYPEIQFSYNNYAQVNHFKHKEDKTLISTPLGSDYDLIINNQNLDLEKDLYTSPFAATEAETFNTSDTIKIGLYDTVKGKFSNDTQPRICFSELTGSSSYFKFTDGTTTSGYIQGNLMHFYNSANPTMSMGFGTNLIPKNSQSLINVLQEIKVLKLNFNLNLIDIINVDYFTPIYLSQYQAYFFIQSINQFNYTEQDITEVELIKINQ